MPGSNPPFVPVGLPREASPGDSLDQRVGLHLLEALDSLDAVYGSAEYFAQAGPEASVGDYTLTRCLECVHADQGAIYLGESGALQLHGDRGAAAALLRADALPRAATARPAFHNGADARPLLRPEAPDWNVLTCPILVGEKSMGLVVVLVPPATPVNTGDVKLVTAVASQAAIALSRAQHLREVELERQKLQLVVQNHADGIVVLDAEGRTTLCNPIAREYCGTTDVLPLLAGIDPGCTLAALGEAPCERELTLAAAGTTRVVGVGATVIRGRDGQLANVILTLRDLTRHRREERLKRDFLSLISHKFRTPLTALLCAVQMMESADALEREEFVAEMGRRTQDLSVLVDRLLYFTELLEGSWSTRGLAHLRQLGADVEAHFLAESRTADACFVWDLAEDALEVAVPAARLRVALMNLVDNAIKFGSTGSPWVRIASRRVGQDSVAIEVEDRGPGIPADQREQIFASFHQLDADFTGSVAGAGIGLAMVREITVRVGGTLAHRDALPHGCVFTLTLPAARPGVVP